MDLEALAGLMRPHRYLARGVDPGTAALLAVPALGHGLPDGVGGRLVAHALDALSPAAERLVVTAFAEADAGSGPAPREDDPFVPTLRDLITVGAVISPGGGTLAVLQAARAVSDVMATPSSRLAPIVARIRTGSDEERGRLLRLVANAIVARAAAASSSAAATGWEVPDYATALVAAPLAWLLGRGTLDQEPSYAMLASYLGASLPVGTIPAAEAAIRLVLTEVSARWHARKSRPEDQVLLLRALTPALMDAGADAMLRAAMTDAEILTTVIPQLMRFTDARALVKADVDRASADALLRPETGVAVASVLVDVAAELRRWDVHSLLVAKLERPASTQSAEIAAFGPRRRVLQVATVALTARAGAVGERPYGAVFPPADVLVADHGAVVFVVFNSVVDACVWARRVVADRGDRVCVGVGHGRLLGGTDGRVTRLDGPAPQGALASLRPGRVGVSAGAADELAQHAGGAADPAHGRVICQLGAEAVSLELVGGMAGVFELAGAPAAAVPAQPSARPLPVPAPTRASSELRTGEPRTDVPRRAPVSGGARVGASGFGEAVDPFQLAASGPQQAADLYWDESPTTVRAGAPEASPTLTPTISPLPTDLVPPVADPLDEVTIPGMSVPFEALPDDAIREATETGAPQTPIPPPAEAMFEESFPFTVEGEESLFAVPEELQEAGEATDGGLGAPDTIILDVGAPQVNATDPVAVGPTQETELRIEDVFDFGAEALRPPSEPLVAEVFDAAPVVMIPGAPEPTAAAPGAPADTFAEDPFDVGPPDPAADPFASEATVIMTASFLDPVGEGDPFAFPVATPDSAPPADAAPALFEEDLFAAAPPPATPEPVASVPAPPAVAAPAPAVAPLVQLEPERRSAAPAIDLGMDDFSFDLGGEHDLADPGGLGRKLAPKADVLAGFGFERTDDDATHLERSPEEPVRAAWSPIADPGHAFDMEVEEDEGNTSAFDEPTSVGSEVLGFAVVDPETATTPAVAPKYEPPVEPVARRGKPVAMDFEHLFRGYCFYLEKERAVFGRPYGARMVDRHAYGFDGDVEEAYRAFLQDKIKEGFVPQTDMAGEVPPTMTLLPLNLERLGRAWSRLT